MIRINAAAISTLMMKLYSFWNRTNKRFIKNAMSRIRFAPPPLFAHGDVSVSVFIKSP